MRQFAEACRGLKDACLRASASRSPAGTSASTTRPARRRSRSVPGGRRARRDGGRRRVVRRPPGAPRASRSSCSARPARSLSGSEWANVVHGHLEGCRPGPTSPPSAPREPKGVRRSAWSPAPTTSPTAGWRRRWPRPAAPRRRRHRHGPRRPVLGAVRGVGGAGPRHGRQRRRGAAERFRRSATESRSPRSARPAATRSSWRGVRGALGGASARPGPRRCRGDDLRTVTPPVRRRGPARIGTAARAVAVPWRVGRSGSRRGPGAARW